jgi:hypothetical protein
MTTNINRETLSNLIGEETLLKKESLLDKKFANPELSFFRYFDCKNSFVIRKATDTYSVLNGEVRINKIKN